MKKSAMFVVSLFFAMSLASGANGQMTFHLDFGQDGTYESSWTLAVDEEVSVDVYVSAVPDPGLQTMGFVMTYDSSLLQVVSSDVDNGNWPIRTEDDATAGQVDMTGGRLEGGLPGDNIRLGTIRFRCLDSGESDLKLFDRSILDSNFDPDCFVLADCVDECVLDDDIPGDVPVGTITGTIVSGCAGDLDWDGDVDGSDLAQLAASPDLLSLLSSFADEFGRTNCFE